MTYKDILDHCKRTISRLSAFSHLGDYQQKELEEHKMVAELIEKQQKYKWNDLRKNPDDLPKKEYETVLVWLKCKIVDVAIWNKEYGFRPWYAEWFQDCPPEWDAPVVAWCEIEPFEEEVE